MRYWLQRCRLSSIRIAGSALNCSYELFLCEIRFNFSLYTYIVAAEQIECSRFGHRVFGECYALNNSDSFTLQMSPFKRPMVIDQYNMQEQCTIFTCFGWDIDFQLSAK